MKLTAALYGVPADAVHPRWFEAGEECPPELIEAARALGVLAGDEEHAPAAKPAKRVRG
jgi:hypothetical protein